MESTNMQKAKAIYFWTLKKYLPISIAYWVFLFLSLPVIQVFCMIAMKSMAEYRREMDDAPEIMILFIFVAIAMSTVSSFVCFSYMHNKRCVDFFGSLPVSRRTMFFTRYLAVVTMSVVPMLIVGALGSGLSLTYEGCGVYMESLLLAMLAIVGNITIIAFISLCSGTVADMIITYLALNAAYPICIGICGIYPTVVLPGLGDPKIEASVYTFFTPLVAPYTGAYGDCKGIHIFWWILLSAVVLTGCYFLCKKRKAETAQNAFTFSVLSNTIKFIACFAAGFGVGWVLSNMCLQAPSVKSTYIWFFI